MLRTIRRYISNLLGQVDTDGIDVDETFNALSAGPRGWTVSKRVAFDAGYRSDGRTGPRKFVGCVFCRFLGAFVQPSHCALQFAPGPSNWLTWIRAGVAFAWGVYSLFHWWGWAIDASIFVIFAAIELISRMRPGAYMQGSPK